MMILHRKEKKTETFFSFLRKIIIYEYHSTDSQNND